ncbi:uncharacterized protein PG986_003536 [Apiospora aurea]|uniref:Uncharacterized protein n=1 Tax=Apiospora aurea TaxID=335848 RepID=A0ABR1QTK1_9PEZI
MNILGHLKCVPFQKTFLVLNQAEAVSCVCCTLCLSWAVRSPRISAVELRSRCKERGFRTVPGSKPYFLKSPIGKTRSAQASRVTMMDDHTPLLARKKSPQRGARPDQVWQQPGSGAGTQELRRPIRSTYLTASAITNAHKPPQESTSPLPPTETSGSGAGRVADRMHLMSNAEVIFAPHAPIRGRKGLASTPTMKWIASPSEDYDASMVWTGMEKSY